MPAWLSALIALGAPAAVASVCMYRAVNALRSRRPEPDEGLDRVLHTADGVRTPWRPRPVPGRVEDRGASAVEYGLMVAAVAAVLVGIVFGMGGVLAALFSGTASSFQHCASANPSPCPDPTSSTGGSGSSSVGGGTDTVPPTDGQ